MSAIVDLREALKDLTVRDEIRSIRLENPDTGSGELMST